MPLPFPLTEMLERVLPIVAPIALASAWEERDVGVQRAMLDGLLPLLKGEHANTKRSKLNSVTC